LVGGGGSGGAVGFGWLPTSRDGGFSGGCRQQNSIQPMVRAFY